MLASEPRTLDILIEDWLTAGNRQSVNTRDAYSRDVRQFFTFSGKTHPADVTHLDLIEYQRDLNARAKSDATKYRKITALRSFLTFLHDTKAITEDFRSTLVAPKVIAEFKNKAVGAEYVQTMIDTTASDADSLLVRMLYVTAARVSELLALRWSNFKASEDGGAFVQILGKGKKLREVYVGKELWDDLCAKRGDIEDDEPLFPISRHAAARIVGKLAKASKVGVKVTPHRFRHGLATDLLEQGATLAQVRDQLGHADIKTTSLYIHATDRAEMIRNLKIK